jgi:hypothetical protein
VTRYLIAGVPALLAGAAVALASRLVLMRGQQLAK